MCGTICGGADVNRRTMRLNTRAIFAKTVSLPSLLHERIWRYVRNMAISTSAATFWSVRDVGTALLMAIILDMFGAFAFGGDDTC